MAYSEGIAPYYDLLAKPDDPPDEAGTFLFSLLRPGDTVLDIGAGTGTTAIALAERGVVVTALEPDREMYAMLLSRLSRRHDIGARLTPVPKGAGFDTLASYDLVCSFSVLHLLRTEEQDALCSFARSRVHSNGRVVLELPVTSPLRAERPLSVVGTRTLGRIRVEHLSSMSKGAGGRWLTHWRFATYLDDQPIDQVERTFDWEPLSHERTAQLLQRHRLAVEADLSGFDRQPYRRGESRVRLVVARAV
jgi:SAM-dependent methyltransferase